MDWPLPIPTPEVSVLSLQYSQLPQHYPVSPLSQPTIPADIAASSVLTRTQRILKWHQCLQEMSWPFKALGVTTSLRAVRCSNPAKGNTFFSSQTRPQTGSRIHPASYSTGNRILSPEVKRPKREVYHSSPSGAERGVIPLSPPPKARICLMALKGKILPSSRHSYLCS